jgi:cell division septum initiation protein DivIVA
MEKSGKKFYAVRVQYGDADIVLANPVYIDPPRHMNNQRFSAGATVVNDDEASALLDDVIRDNPDKQAELAHMINRINQTRRESRERAG